MIAPYFLPRRRVGSLRPFKFAINLREFGWEPHIITIASDGLLTSKEQEMLKEISVYRLPTPLDRTNRSGSQLKNTTTQEKEDSFSIGDWIDKHFPVDTWLPFFLLRLRKIKQIARQISPDAIWSTGDPWSAHWVGYKVSRLFPDLYWMADFRDPWTLSNTDLKERSAFSSAIDRKVEAKLIGNASMLSFTTGSTRELYKKYYVDLKLETTTIYNSFDNKLFNSDLSENIDLALDSDYLNVLFFGRFRKLSKAKPVIDILSCLKANNPSAAANIRVHSFGSLSNSDYNYAVSKGVEKNFIIQDPVPAENGKEILEQADLLLLSTNVERTDIIPAKFWDYLAAERPILSIAPNKEIASILKETGTGVQYASQHKKEVTTLLYQCIIAKEKGEELPIPFSPVPEEIQQYSARLTTQKLAHILQEHIQ